MNVIVVVLVVIFAVLVVFVAVLIVLLLLLLLFAITRSETKILTPTQYIHLLTVEIDLKQNHLMYHPTYTLQTLIDTHTRSQYTEVIKMQKKINISTRRK